MAVSAGFPPHWEVAAQHVYPRLPRSTTNASKMSSYRDVGSRFLRTAMFLSPTPCFEVQQQFNKCCRIDDVAVPPSWCFDTVYTRESCCRKQAFSDQLFKLQGWENTSYGVLPRTTARRRDCKWLHAARSADLVQWIASLLALPGWHQALCAAGSLAQRFQEAGTFEWLGALTAICAAIESRCPTRRALVTFRRNLMLWHHRTSRTWPPRLAAVYGRALMALERCRRALSDGPVVHLHMPKTAGSSVCEWANANGLPSARHLTVGKRKWCHLRGDGPFWIGEDALPATCRQRLREAKLFNASWMSVERWVDLPLCEDLRYVVALREPVARAVHQFEHLLFYFLGQPRIHQILDVDGFRTRFFRKLWRSEHIRVAWDRRLASAAAKKPPAQGRRVLGGGPAVMPDWLGLWSGLAGNYQVRSLAGSGSRAFLEDGAFAELRLAAAKETLEQFDVVLAVGRGLIARRQEELFRFLLRVPRTRWSRSVPFVSHRNRAEPFPGYAYRWSLGELEGMRRRNAADTALLGYARLLQRLDLEYFALVAPRAAASADLGPTDSTMKRAIVGLAHGHQSA